MGRDVDVEHVFPGRRDVAPVVGFEGDPEFALNGGVIGSNLDRKAAVFVFRADGLCRGRRRAWDR